MSRPTTLSPLELELLEALTNLLAVHEGEGGTRFHAGDIARAAIAKARAPTTLSGPQSNEGTDYPTNLSRASSSPRQHSEGEGS